MSRLDSTRDIIPTFPGRLRELRDQAGLTQAQLAARAGTSQVAVSLLESGRRAPSFRLAAQLAQALRTTTDALLMPAEENATETSTRYKVNGGRDLSRQKKSKNLGKKA